MPITRYKGFKVSSCGAKTRYEYDSQSTVDLALTKGRYFDGSDWKWRGVEDDMRNYVDLSILGGRVDSDDA